jgi:hypothetical protein
MSKAKLLSLLIVALTTLTHSTLLAQERFELERRGGHYYFTATINAQPVDIMVESGIPALLVGQSVYDSCLSGGNLSFQPSQQKIRLLNRLYNIVYRAEGQVAIGNLIYDGPVFVLEGYEGVSVPIQRLKDASSGRAVVALDLGNNYMEVGCRDKRIGGRKFKLEFDPKLGFPLVTATIDVDTPEGRAKLKGRLIVDFGNPSLLFLLKQHPSLAKALEKDKIALKDAFDRQGRLVAQGLYAERVSLLGRSYADISIGVTDKMSSIEHLGFLGTKFFASPVVFDFDKGVMTME